MTLPTQEFQAPERLVGTIQENPSVDTTQEDPLINRDLQHAQYIGIFAIAVGLTAMVGFFSRRFEHALLFATALSVVLIVFFLTV